MSDFTKEDFGKALSAFGAHKTLWPSTDYQRIIIEALDRAYVGEDERDAGAAAERAAILALMKRTQAELGTRASILGIFGRAYAYRLLAELARLIERGKHIKKDQKP